MSYDDSVTRAWKMTPNPEASGSGPQTWLAAAQATGARADKRLPPIWRYDAFENRTSEIYGGSSTGNAPIPGSTSATYNANNQVQSASPGPVPNYDGAGNITYDGNNQYLYDAEGRICAVQSLLSGSAMTGYLYDAEGTRIAKGNITSFSCDTTLNANGQPNNGFIMTTSYILGPGNEQLTGG